MAVFRLAHLSDLHLTGAAEEEALARSVFRSLRDYDVDHVVVTGDLSEHGERSAFRMFDNARRKFGYGPRRSTVLIGNHDIRRRRAFASRFGGGAVTIRELDHGDLCLIGLDSAQVVTGFPSGAHDPKGYLDDDQLEELEQALRCQGSPQLIAPGSAKVIAILGSSAWASLSASA